MSGRVAPVVMTLVLVLSMLSQPGAVGTAHAATVEECAATAGTAAVATLLSPASAGISGPLSADKIAEDCWEHGWFEDSTDAGDNLTHTDHYQQSLSVKDSQDTFITSMNNRLTDTRSAAWAEVEITVGNELNNGTSSSVTKDEANVSLDNYYSRLQYNVVQDWNAKAKQYKYINSTGTEVALWDDGGSSWTMLGTHTYNYTMVNGTTVEVTGIVADSGTNTVLYGPAIQSSHVTDLGTYDAYWDGDGDNSGSGSPTYLGVADPDDPTGNPGTHLHALDYGKIMSDSRTQESNIEGQVGSFVDGVYTQYEAGDLNISDVYSPTTLAGKAATDYNTTGSNSFVAIKLASLGYSGDLNTSTTVTTNTSDATYSGTLFYTGDDLDSLEANTTYDTANLNGVFVMAVSSEDGTGYIEEWSQAKVTIEELRDVDSGEQVDNTTVVKYTYETANASNLQERYDRLQQLRDEYEEAATSGGGGSGGGGFGTTGLAIGAAVVIGIGALVYRREQDGDGRGGGRRGR